MTASKKRENALLIELPEYKAPSARTIAIYVWEKVKDYLTKAGTTIFVASIIMWVLLNFGLSGYSQDMSYIFRLHHRPVSLCLSSPPSALASGRSWWPSSPASLPRKWWFPAQQCSLG